MLLSTHQPAANKAFPPTRRPGQACPAAGARRAPFAVNTDCFVHRAAPEMHSEVPALLQQVHIPRASWLLFYNGFSLREKSKKHM